MNYPEILAPAGSLEALTAGIRCGANAVYVGGMMYSARNSSAGFSLDDLQKASDLCRLYGVKLHIAVNTLLSDSELSEFQVYLQEIGKFADACIVQDLGAVKAIRHILPDMPIHASTQMSIHSVKGALQAKALGCSRVVLAREMSETELQEVCQLPIETEVFVHGALCMSVSGQCSFSALVGGRSANRGQCAQACRLPWRTPNGTNQTALSLKDLSLVQHVSRLREMGVDSFKIEGRLKRPEYVATAVTALRNALEGIAPDMETLQAAFSRSGFTDGYFTSKKKDMFGFRRKEDVLAGQKVLSQIQQTYQKVQPISTLDFNVQLHEQIPSILTATDEKGNSVTVEGDIPEIAQKSPLTKDMLARSLQKLGGTIYECGEITLENPDNLILSASSCNALRRNAVEKMDLLRIEQHTPDYRINADLLPIPHEMRQHFPKMRLHVRTMAQFEQAQTSGEIVCIPLKLAKHCKPSVSIWVECPRILEHEQEITSQLQKLHEIGYTDLLCHNLADVRIGSELGYHLHGGFGLNCTNSLTVQSLQELGLQDVTASIELRMSNIVRLGDVLPVGAYVYGRLPMMLFRVCPIRSQDGCQKKNCFLTDRTGRKFPLLCSGNYQELMNFEILWLADKNLSNLHYLDFYFTDELPEQIPEILNAYQNSADIAPKNRTNGLYFKGGLR